jgi:PII-like signaling protein
MNGRDRTTNLGKEKNRMRHVEAAVQLRIFLGEDDKYEGRPLYEEIVVQAQRSGLAGATVFRGYLGYGKASGLNPGKILRSSKDLPVVVEIMDSEGKVNAFMEILDKVLYTGVATIEKVQLYRFSPKPKGKA